MDESEELLTSEKSMGMMGYFITEDCIRLFILEALGCDQKSLHSYVSLQLIG